MKRIEETIDLRQSYDEIMAKIKNNNYVISPELLNDEQFFFHILKLGDAEILITFFDAASKNEVSIKKIIESQDGHKAFEYAAQNNDHEVIKLLLEYAKEEVVDIIRVFEKSHYAIFQHAAKNTNHKVMQLLLEYPNHTIESIEKVFTKKNYATFMSAATNTNHEVMQSLLEHKYCTQTNVKNALKYLNYLAFSRASENDNHEVMRLLLEYNDTHNLKIDLREALLKKYDSVLLSTVKNSNHHMLELLLKHFKNAGVSLKNELEDSDTVLQQVAANNDSKMMKLLLEHLDQKKTGIQNILNRQSEHLSFYPAMIDQSPDVLKLLLQEGYIRGINIRAILTSKDNNILRQAARNENINMIKLLLEYLNDSQANTNGTNAHEDYSSVFRYATRNKNPEVIKQLFDNKTALGIKTTQAVNHIYHLSLSLAIVLENIEIVKCLLDHAKNLNIDVRQLLESEDNTITSPESKQRAIILHNILKSPNSKMLDLLLKTLAELENGNEAISTLIHKHLSKLLSSSHINETTIVELENGKEAISTIIDKPLSSSHTKEKLALALSYIKAENKESFIKCSTDILESDQFTVRDEVFVSRSIPIGDGSYIFANKALVTRSMKIEDDSVKNAII
ncbi:hypothetical protein [Candidatus Lariskella endosymbiont of Epinotia ramella]|uniref:hypothetical protein n=1 Tax=Candidatus Lariskella endosymbiont of Epinotia ramella TaxID=3066224 RepID=UPI0030CF61FE